MTEREMLGAMLWLFPTWVLQAGVWPFLPAAHPWKLRGRPFTMREWAEGSTDLNFSFGVVFWISTWLLLAVGTVIILKG